MRSEIATGSAGRKAPCSWPLPTLDPALSNEPLDGGAGVSCSCRFSSTAAKHAMSAVEGVERYQFRHALIQGALCEELSIDVSYLLMNPVTLLWIKIRRIAAS